MLIRVVAHDLIMLQQFWTNVFSNTLIYKIL